jgi:hypothetical protein
MYGTAYDFVNTDQSQVDVNNGSTNILSRDSAFTYALWLKPGATQMAPTTTVIGTTGHGYQLQIVQSGSNWALKLANHNSPAPSLTSTIAIPSDVWTHVAITKDPTVSGSAAVSFYVNGGLLNGGLQESGTIGQSSGTSSTGSNGAARRMFFGASGVIENYYQGGMDEVYVYNEVLDAATIAGLSVVPEPGSLVLISLGAVSMGGYFLRKRK